MKQELFFSIVIGFVSGTIVESRVGLSLYTVLFLLLVSSATLIAMVVRGKLRPKAFSHILIAFLTAVFCILLGMLRLSHTEASLQDSILSKYEEKNVKLIGIAIDDPVRKTDLAKLVLRVKALEIDNRIVTIEDEMAHVYTDPFEELHYGDVVVVDGKLQRIKNKDKSNFDYVSYSKKDGVSYQIFHPTISVQRNDANPVITTLKSVRNYFERTLSRNLSEPHSSLLSGMLISGKNALPQSVQDEFIRTGLIHIVVLSGFNIAIIIKFLNLIFVKVGMKRKVSFVLTITILILFVLMAGATPPVLRAVLMASIVLIGKSVYRSLDANKVLLFVAFILVLINPYSAAYDPSFQLSFLATFAIINLSPWFEQFFVRVKNETLREVLSQTCAATVFVSPFVFYLMGNFSIVALPVNIIILPFIPFLMLLGFLLVVLSFVPILVSVLSYMTFALSYILLSIVHIFANLPFASITITKVPFISIVPIYMGIFIFLYRKKQSSNSASPSIDLTLPH